LVPGKPQTRMRSLSTRLDGESLIMKTRKKPRTFCQCHSTYICDMPFGL
jgi:hypothetical protein